MPELEVRDLCKRYNVGERGVRRFFEKPKEILFKDALSHVSFKLGCGMYGLIGPNGAGKSTLMRIVIGILKADKGEVLWDGTPTDKAGIEFRRLLGYMPQQQGMYDSFTGRRFLAYMCALKEIGGKMAEAEILRTAEIVNMSDALDKKLSACSGGMKQRLLLAAALLGNPKLLVLDEPTAGLDPKERVRLRETLAAMAEDKIILDATHVVSDVETVADGILLLKDGQLLDMAAPEVLIEKYAPGQNLEDVYLRLFESGGSL